MDFKNPHATLHDAIKIINKNGTFYRGVITGDTKGRFSDGTLVRTSYAVAEIEMVDTGERLLATLNTLYKLEGEVTVVDYREAV